MQTFDLKAALTCGILVLAALTGVVTTAMGRPLNVPVSTVHKLLSLAAIVLAVLLAIDLLGALGLAVPVLALVLCTGLFFLGVLVTGALLSFETLASVPLRAVHTALPFLAIAGAALLVYTRVR